MSRGRIRKALSGFYYVDVDGRTVTCRARGKFRQEGRSPLVGDWVEVKETGEGEGMVWEIEPRRSAFDRPAAANVDQLVAVASLAVPVTDPFLIDRVSAIAALKDCGVVVCVNKCDLAAGEPLAEVYRAAGFPTVCTSAETGEGLEELKLESSFLEGAISTLKDLPQYCPNLRGLELNLYGERPMTGEDWRELGKLSLESLYLYMGRATRA